MSMNEIKESVFEEDDEDIKELLRLQNEFLEGKQKPAATCARINLKKNLIKKEKNVTFLEKDIKDTIKEKNEILKKSNKKTNYEPTLSLQTSNELLVSTIYEKFTGFFECPERCASINYDWSNNYSFQCYESENFEDVGFPEVFDLSNYWTETNIENKDVINLDKKHATKKSIFSIAFDNLINEKKLQTKKESKFKKSKDSTELHNSNNNKTKLNIEETLKNKKNIEEETIKNLEIIVDEKINPNFRLAIDPINLNFSSKIIKTTLPRQEAKIIQLFDVLKIPPARSVKISLEEKKINDLCDYARTKLNDIQELYLEKIQLNDKKTVLRFAQDVNPILNGAWSFVPIRRVFDTVSCRQIDKLKDETENVTNDDIEICKLALLWSVLLMIERETFFYLLSQPEEIFVRTAEIYLLGPNLFQNDIINQCVSIILHKFIFKKGLKNLLILKTTASIALLDAFLPFYEDLLKRFEEYSLGNDNFSLMILSAVYLNASFSDRLTLAQVLWMPEKNVVRQITLQKTKAKDILKKIKETQNSELENIENTFYESYSHLLAMYAVAIRDEKVTKERNPTVFEIAASEIGEFIKYYEKKEITKKLTDEKTKEFDILISLLRSTLSNKLII